MQPTRQLKLRPRQPANQLWRTKKTGTMAVTSEDDSVDGNEKLVGAGGIDENVPAGNLSDVEWKEDDPLFEFNDENVTIPQTPDAALMSVQTSPENKTASPLESPLKKKPCFHELIAVHLMKATPPLCLECIMVTWSA